MADLIPARGYVAVFTTLDTDSGRTLYYPRPLIAWTVGEDGRLVGHYIGSYGNTTVASNVPNFYRYMTEDQWAVFGLTHRAPKSVGSEPS
ncbi:DUF6253 family protein [Streptomyces sp. 11x1]|uniref:DUF6253 family protein n=1 Tax=Streptomyces sp. 11x1 TaxID=3038642 RepID=UPI00292DA52F|nr:DUF6253 family protein [Streptomyces sp. 11x1]WNZ11480.1 hypothetical protein P8T65_30640 [Streptomyces sp. 11x1]